MIFKYHINWHKKISYKILQLINFCPKITKGKKIYPPSRLRLRITCVFSRWVLLQSLCAPNVLLNREVCIPVSWKINPYKILFGLLKPKVVEKGRHLFYTIKYYYCSGSKYSTSNFFSTIAIRISDTCSYSISSSISARYSSPFSSHTLRIITS